MAVVQEAKKKFTGIFKKIQETNNEQSCQVFSSIMWKIQNQEFVYDNEEVETSNSLYYYRQYDVIFFEYAKRIRPKNMDKTFTTLKYQYVGL